MFDSAGWGDELSIENKCASFLRYRNIRLTIPGVNRINEIIGCILRNNEEYDNDRRAGKPDTRYHCCFYFIAPHRCKGIDVEFMRRLANHIIVVPIIAKADAMTIEETNRFKEIVRTDAFHFSSSMPD